MIDLMKELSDEQKDKLIRSPVLLDIIIPNEVLTKEMLSMAVKYKSSTGEL